MLANVKKNDRVFFVYNGNVTNGHRRVGVVDTVHDNRILLRERDESGQERYRWFSNHLIDQSTLAVL